MKIYIMRHGEAQQFAPSDAQRALTTEAVMNPKLSRAHASINGA